MRINIIAAVARNRAIGIDNKLIYWLPNDLKRFKALTTGHTIIMGRHTFESLPKGALPNRRNIVLSRTATEFAGCDTYASIDEALAHCGDNEDIYNRWSQHLCPGARPGSAALPHRGRRHAKGCRRLLPRLQRMARDLARAPRQRRASRSGLRLRRL